MKCGSCGLCRVHCKCDCPECIEDFDDTIRCGEDDIEPSMGEEIDKED